uniref:GOLD domain-containing protein n=1 Tax=Heterorhabditis bacteriophora TaxID=37862 RepID=A0A1I7XV77_HETBA
MGGLLDTLRKEISSATSFKGTSLHKDEQYEEQNRINEVPLSPSVILKMLTIVLMALSGASTASNSHIEVPDHMYNGTLYSISPFSPKVFVRTDEFELNYTSCVQFSYKFMEKK